MENFAIHGEGPAARFTKVLASAGCNLINERDRNFGMIGYNTAMLVWRSYESRGGYNPTTDLQRPAVGRNDRCPCGSGLKYKKCCLSRASELSEKPMASSKATIPFGPDIIPRLWDDDGTYSDATILRDLLERDPNLKALRFSTEKIEVFLKKHRYDPECFQKQDDETEGRFFDKLAAQYVEEFGEHKVLEQTTDRFIAAAKNAETADQLRALATGMFFASAYRLNDDTDNPLTAIIFRLSVRNVLRPITILRRVASRFKGKLKEIGEEAFLQPDTSKEIWSSLSEEEKRACAKVTEDMHEDVRNCIVAKKFPVGLPYATTLPFWHCVQRLEKSGKESQATEALTKVIQDSADNFTDDDYRLFTKSLEDWLDKNKNQHDEVSEAVRNMHMLTKCQGISSLVPLLLVDTCQFNKCVFFDDEEAKLVETWQDLSNFDDLIKYAYYFESHGYPQIANRIKGLVTVTIH